MKRFNTVPILGANGLCALTLAASLLALSNPASALTSAEAATLVQNQYGGQVLDIQRVSTRQADAYRIKLLQPSGRVKLLLIDTKQGRPIKVPKVKK